jgi:Tfp pilus assembly protein PilO
MKAITSKLTPQSLVLLLLCGAGIVAFIFLVILPSQKASAELDNEIEQLNTRIERQKILKPVFVSLFEKSKAKKSIKLPTAQKAKLARDEIPKLINHFQELAQRHHLKLQEISPDVNSLKDGSGHLLMNLSLTGEFLNFRGFLLDVGALPALEHAEELKISSVNTTRELQLKLWMAQE